MLVHPGTSTRQVNNSENANDFPVLITTCTRPHIALIGLQMLYLSMILIAMNVMAILTIRFKANYNEVKYIAYC